MTDKVSPSGETVRQITAAELAGEGKISPTAASASNRMFGDSGVQTYRVQMQTAIGAAAFVDVDAETGDKAAELALAKFPGAKVLHIEPAPQQVAA